MPNKYIPSQFDKLVIGPIRDYLLTRSERERSLLLITALCLGFVLLYNLLNLVAAAQDKFSKQASRLKNTRAELESLLDDQSSPLKTYLLLSKQVEDLEVKFEERLKSEGNITSLEGILKKLVGSKYFTLQDRPAQSFEGGLVRNPFSINFKTGSLKQVAQVLKELTEGDSTFSIESLRLEKTFRKYLSVDITASSMRKGQQENNQQ